MHHHHLEHQRKRAEPFSIVGPAEFIAASIGWGDVPLAFESALANLLKVGSSVDVAFGGSDPKTGMLIEWRAQADASVNQATIYTLKFCPVDKSKVKSSPKPALYDAAPDLAERLARSSDGSAHDVAAVARLWDPSCSVHQRIGRPDLLVVQSCTELPDVAKEHIRLASQAAVNIQYEIADPWVKVGTTTIDGDVCGLWESDDLDEMRGRVRFIGGHHLRLEWWETNRGVDIAFCDIVRRQSEIDAERVSDIIERQRSEPGEWAQHLVAKPRAACQECGPHGNAGRVLGADLWYPCTLCAGGYPGDVHEMRQECDGRDERGMSCAARDGGPEDCPKCYPGRRVLTAGNLVFDEEVEVQRARDQGAAAGRAAIGLRGAMELAALRSSLTEATVDNLRRYEDLMADFKAAITIPNTPRVHMTFGPAGHRPGEFSFSASDLCMPTHSRAPFAVTADVGQAKSTLGAVRYPTRDEYANYLSAHLATNLGTVDYDDPSISRAARMIDECLAEKR